jgi:4-amino-4-deoxy-L-arabinose transferase-like glycosyltransferase
MKPVADLCHARWLLGLATTATCLAIMIATEPALSIVWDEGYTLGREARLRAWFGALRDPAAFATKWQPAVEDLVPPNVVPAPRRDQLNTRAGLFNAEVLEWFWPFSREEPDGHPPVYALCGLIGDLVVPAWEALPRARLGPMLVFSLICGAIFVFFQARCGFWPAMAAAGAWCFQPHLFALAHYATYDGLLTCFWVGSVLSFAKVVEGPEPTRSLSRWPWLILFGVLTGCAMGTKLTGWFLPVPFFAWVLVKRDRRGLVAILVGGFLALSLLVVLNPSWWHKPVFGLDRFFRSNLSRATTTPLKTLFLGTIYETPTGSLPWCNTLVWTILVTPIGFLVLALVGVAHVLRRPCRDSPGSLFATHWAFLMVLRALPHTPGHDGVRQFLPAFGMLVLLAGLGAASVKRRLGGWGRSLIALAVIEGALSVAVMMPVPLSYYSPLTGGLPGAARLGMEPTYYWDSLQPEILNWLNSHTTSHQKVMFSRYPTSWLYLRQTHRLKAGILPYEPGQWAWYVMQNRPGAFRKMERDLIAHGHPAKVYSRWGVPLLWIFPYAEVEAWQSGKWPP